MGTKTRIIRIGNSQGIRIPKQLIEQARLGEEVELEAQPDQLVIRAARRPREGWDEQFRLMAEQSNNELLDRDALSGTRWDATEWEW